MMIAAILVLLLSPPFVSYFTTIKDERPDLVNSRGNSATAAAIAMIVGLPWLVVLMLWLAEAPMHLAVRFVPIVIGVLLWFPAGKLGVRRRAVLNERDRVRKVAELHRARAARGEDEFGRPL